jgi:hypothetical protein
MLAAKGRTLRGLLVLALAVATAAPAAASLPQSGRPDRLDVDPAALLAAVEAEPAPAPVEPARFALLEEAPDDRFELLDPAAVEIVLFTGRPPQPHLFPELATRVRAIDFLGWRQPQEIQWFAWEIVVGEGVSASVYAFAGRAPLDFSDPLGLLRREILASESRRNRRLQQRYSAAYETAKQTSFGRSAAHFIETSPEFELEVYFDTTKAGLWFDPAHDKFDDQGNQIKARLVVGANSEPRT